MKKTTGGKVSPSAPPPKTVNSRLRVKKITKDGVVIVETYEADPDEEPRSTWGNYESICHTE